MYREHICETVSRDKLYENDGRENGIVMEPKEVNSLKSTKSKLTLVILGKGLYFNQYSFLKIC